MSSQLPDGRGRTFGIHFGGVLCRMGKMNGSDPSWQIASDYLAIAEVVRPKYRSLLLEIMERYCEIELGDQPAHIRIAIQRLRAMQLPPIN